MSTCTADSGPDLFWKPNAITGFLPRTVPASPRELASSRYPGLRAIGTIAPRLGALSDDELQAFVDELPGDFEVDPATLSPVEREGITRAYTKLAAHLIHRPRFAPRRELPPAVARPLWSFSASVGRPPSLTYASFVLANFINAIRPRMRAADLEIAQTLTGTPDEEWFIAVHLSVETAGGAIVHAVNVMERALGEDDEDALVGALEEVESSVAFAAEVMPTIRERLRAVVFVQEIRPLLYGHAQIRFRGVPGDPLVSYIGETGAQSGAIRAADSALGTPHSDLTTTSMSNFLACAPPAHPRFCGVAENVGWRLASVGSARVREARRGALRALVQFRRTHFRVVAEYLTPSGEPLASHGTGGTIFRSWLQRIIDETESALANV